MASRLYDLGNMCLLAEILLFPSGQLRPRASIPFLHRLAVAVRADGRRLPADLRHLHGRRRDDLAVAAAPYRERDSAADQMGAARLSRATPCSSLAYLSDMTKLHVGSFGTQLTLEVIAGLSFGLAFLCLQLGLLIALLRFRLYDAEAVISRSANIALITLGVTAVFAGAADALKQVIYNFTGNNGSEGRSSSPPRSRRCWSIRSRSGSRAGRKSASRRICSCFATTFPNASATCARPPRSPSCSTTSCSASSAGCGRSGAPQ